MDYETQKAIAETQLFVFERLKGAVKAQRSCVEVHPIHKAVIDAKIKTYKEIINHLGIKYSGKITIPGYEIYFQNNLSQLNNLL
jgi:hypothetical protein